MKSVDMYKQYIYIYTWALCVIANYLGSPSIKQLSKKDVILSLSYSVSQPYIVIYKVKSLYIVLSFSSIL